MGENFHSFKIFLPHIFHESSGICHRVSVSKYQQSTYSRTSKERTVAGTRTPPHVYLRRPTFKSKAEVMTLHYTRGHFLLVKPFLVPKMKFSILTFHGSLLKSPWPPGALCLSKSEDLDFPLSILSATLLLKRTEVTSSVWREKNESQVGLALPANQVIHNELRNSNQN